MRIAQLKLKNFRCFGPEPVTVDLDDLTALIGTNGSGKTAILVALARLFGASQTDRRLQPDDFHIPHDTDPSTIDQIELTIEARLEFPELMFATEESAAIPPCFNHMVLGEGDNLFCRVRLEGVWTRSNLPEGDVDDRAYWITTESAEVKDEHKRPMQAYERSMIHVLYVPAFLHSQGVSTSRAVRIYKTYGEDAVAKVQANRSICYHFIPQCGAVLWMGGTLPRQCGRTGSGSYVLYSEQAITTNCGQGDSYGSGV